MTQSDPGIRSCDSHVTLPALIIISNHYLSLSRLVAYCVISKIRNLLYFIA